MSPIKLAAGVARPVRRALTTLAVSIGRAVLRRPQLKRAAKYLLALVPGLRTRTQTMMYQAALASHSRLSNRVKDDADLSPRTVRMLGALQRELARKDQP